MTSQGDEEALLTRIVAARDDARPREVYADWLDEQARSAEADRIRRHLDLERALSAPSDPWEREEELLALTIRAERALPRQQRIELMSRPAVARVGYRGGLLEVVQLIQPDQATLAALPTTVREVRIAGQIEGDPAVLEHVDTLEWQGVQTPDQLDAVGGLLHLRKLSIDAYECSAEEVLSRIAPLHDTLEALTLRSEVLVERLPEMPMLRHLALGHALASVPGEPVDELLIALELESLPHELTSLELGRGSWIADADALTRLPGLTELRILDDFAPPELPEMPALRRLVFAAPRTFRWPHMPLLEHLEMLESVEDGADLHEALEDTRSAAPGLRSLRLLVEANALDPRDFAPLEALERLERAALYGNADIALAVLCNAPALRTLALDAVHLPAEMPHVKRLDLGMRHKAGDQLAAMLDRLPALRALGAGQVTPSPALFAAVSRSSLAQIVVAGMPNRGHLLGPIPRLIDREPTVRLASRFDPLGPILPAWIDRGAR